MHEVEEALGITLGRLNGDLAAEDAEGDHVLCLGLGIVGPGRGLDFESLGCTERGAERLAIYGMIGRLRSMARSPRT